MNRTPFASDEWYHCYTRGVEKRDTFLSSQDYARFQDTLYLSNSKSTLHRSDCSDHESVYLKERSEQLVSIGAYCLMPNHFHILLKANEPEEVSLFMKKLGTSYSMYFNKKYDHVGSIFVKPFRSKHINADDYLRQVFSYIHLNPIEANISTGVANEILATTAMNYQWSSLYDYSIDVESRIEEDILAKEEFLFLKEINLSIAESIEAALEYKNERTELF